MECIFTTIFTNYFDFSGELSEGAESPEGEENKNKGVDGEFISAAHDY